MSNQSRSKYQFVTQILEPLERRAMLSASPHAATSKIPKYDHVVVVVEENHSYDDVLGNSISGPIMIGPGGLIQSPGSSDDYIRSLAKGGASMTNFSGEAHPSQPNYIAMFSGSTYGVTSDAPVPLIKKTSLGGELLKAGYTFKGYSEGLPAVGSTVTKTGSYHRSHAPWSEFSDVPIKDNVPYTQFPAAKDYSKLPTLSFVIPSLSHDMHSGTIESADQWLKKNMGSYATWAKTHNSLLIVTWDEGDGGNHIATIFSGAHIKPGKYEESANHYSMLRTIEDMYGVKPLGNAAKVHPITDIFE